MPERRLFGWLILPDTRWLRRSVRWKTLLLGTLLAALLVVGFVTVGGVPIAADRPDGWLTRHFLHFTFKQSVATSARYIEAPADLKADSRVRLAARHYDMVCANCHGAPGFGQSVIALSMSPRPQYLPKVIDQFANEELFVIVQQGVKFSAMPSWPNATRDDEVWSMVALLRQLPKMSAETYRQMTGVEEAPEATAAMAPGDHVALRPADEARNTPPRREYQYAAPAVGFGDRGLRSHPVALCAGCHGRDGDGSATGGEAPNLTIHDADYLRAALNAFSTGARKSGFMQEVASHLTTEQIDALADYYAGQPVRKTPAPSEPNQDSIKRGEMIALQGIKETATPACSNCHESAGSELVKAPRIAGQSEIYLARQLAAMRRGGRGSTRAWNPMVAEAHALRDNDIAGLAAYYAAQQPTKGGTRTAGPTWPTGDTARGQMLFQTVCTKCHLNDGRGGKDGMPPDITIHSLPYLLQTLYAFRAGARSNTNMVETTQAMSYADIAAVATYLDTLAPQKAILPVDSKAAEQGNAIAQNGDQARAIPACLGCHDDKGMSKLPLIPHLKGQSAAYLQARLDLFASAREGDISQLNPMPAIASKLTAQERANLAAYFASLAPDAKHTEH